MILVKETHPLYRLWHRYKQYISTALESPGTGEPERLADWQNGLFAALVIYALPISLVALLPSMFLEFHMNNMEVVIFDFVAITSFGCLILAKKLSLTARKIIITVLVASFSLIQIMLFGHITVGFAYLFD